MVQMCCKSFGIKILSSNPYALKILQTIFVNLAPVKAFKGEGGGGYLSVPGIPTSARDGIDSFSRALIVYFRQKSTGRTSIRDSRK